MVTFFSIQIFRMLLMVECGTLEKKIN